MIGFGEATVYGRYLFGNKFNYAKETSDGWLFFCDKNGESLGEEQTWDEFENTWRSINQYDKKFTAFCKVKKNWKPYKKPAEEI